MTVPTPNWEEGMALLRQMFEIHPMAIWTTDKDLILTDGVGSRPAAEKRPERSRYAKFLGKHLRDFAAAFGGENSAPSVIVRAHQAALLGSPANYVLSVWGRKSECFVAPILCEEKLVVGTLGFAIDVSDYLGHVP